MIFVIAIFGAGPVYLIVSVEELFAAFVSPGVETVAVLLTLPVTVDARQQPTKYCQLHPLQRLDRDSCRLLFVLQRNTTTPCGSRNKRHASRQCVMTVMTPVVPTFPR